MILCLSEASWSVLVSATAAGQGSAINGGVT